MQLLCYWICLRSIVAVAYGDASALLRSHQLGQAEVHSSGLISPSPSEQSEGFSYEQAREIAEGLHVDSPGDSPDEAVTTGLADPGYTAGGEGADADMQEQPQAARVNAEQQTAQLASEATTADSGEKARLMPSEDASSSLQDSIDNMLADGASVVARDEESRNEAGQLLHEYIRKTELQELRGLLGSLVMGEQGRQRQESDHQLAELQRKERLEQQRQQKLRQQHDQELRQRKQRQQEEELRQLQKRQFMSTTPWFSSEVRAEPVSKAIHTEDHHREGDSMTHPAEYASESTEETHGAKSQHDQVLSANQLDRVPVSRHLDRGHPSRLSQDVLHEHGSQQKHGTAATFTKRGLAGPPQPELHSKGPPQSELHINSSALAGLPPQARLPTSAFKQADHSAKQSFIEDVMGTAVDASTAEVACPVGSVMTSCACREGGQQMGHCIGAEIQTTKSSPKCVAYDGHAVTAHARCGKVPGAVAWSTVRNRDEGAQTTIHESSVQVTCPNGKVATGCSCSSATGNCKSMHAADGTCVGYGVAPRVQSRCVLLATGWIWSMVSNSIKSTDASVACPEGHILTGCACYAEQPLHCGAAWMEGKICKAKSSSDEQRVAAQGICIGLNSTAS
mmetsp:Transcript_45845/g.106556  ORF Transcript_45845/g.106556 Transcript_45845/m.106556 type:complete len:623 (+) Transcript_45845:122-1990(+)